MKPWTIALKDTLIAFRDRNAILLMIAAPLMISMIMGAAFGNMGGNTSPISEISLIIVNADKGELGKNFTEIISSIDVESSEGIKPLFAVEEYIDKDEAIAQVEIGKARGVLYIPVDFSTHVENRGESVNPPL